MEEKLVGLSNNLSKTIFIELNKIKVRIYKPIKVGNNYLILKIE